ncbi:glycosyltransferase [Deltaproteobacteria bacterium IMCC39524]|nr:glycosyltransferase [Deltaproteobacteria bacterium IMCC39524]
MNVLILHPDLRRLGGIECYYTKMWKHYSVPVQHFTIGRRPGERGHFLKIYRLFKDYFSFLNTLSNCNIDIVQVNPSFEFKSFVREGLFVVLAKFKKKKTITFFRGWDKGFEGKINNHYLWLLRALYGKTDAFIVLSDGFVRTLKGWGCSQAIYKENTVLDDNCLDMFDIDHSIETRINSKCWRILFLSRIFKQKGIYEIIEAFNILKAKYPRLELVIAGDGPELQSAKKYVFEKSISDITFTGDVRDEEKNTILTKCHIFCFPTYHNEGLPNSIVEAMAFGLPIVTRPVGGIPDFFLDGKHGFLTASKKPKKIAGLIEKLLLDEDLYKKISNANHSYATENFLASQAAGRFERLYNTILSKHSS